MEDDVLSGNQPSNLNIFLLGVKYRSQHLLEQKQLKRAYQLKAVTQSLQDNWKMAYSPNCGANTWGPK